MAFIQLLCYVGLLICVQSYGKFANFTNRIVLIFGSIRRNDMLLRQIGI